LLVEAIHGIHHAAVVDVSAEAIEAAEQMDADKVTSTFSLFSHRLTSAAMPRTARDAVDGIVHRVIDRGNGNA
jgi:hypothetical protein